MTWWTSAVFYEIYVRSFQDSGADGVGDLNGIAARLDYVAELGVDAIWITPFYPSPQVDFGYDVSDHEAIDPQFGTLHDFDRLVARAHARGIKVVVDVVLNHTSDQHPWFRESRTSRSSRRRDWYIWRDGAAGGGPPNNWESAFGGPAWTFDAATSQWYYHFFYPEQPDLNWRNPDVERRMFATVKFWLDRGVDGFRLDAVNTLFEDPELRDNPRLPAPEVTLIGVRTQHFVRTARLPEVHDVLTRLRRFVDRHSSAVVLISEAYVETPADLVRFYGAEEPEIHLPFNFFIAQVPALDASAFRQAVDQFEAACGAPFERGGAGPILEERAGRDQAEGGTPAVAPAARAETGSGDGTARHSGYDRWPSLVLSNHDIERACDRLADGHDPDAVARLLATLLLTLRGSPFIYYGEEIGMRTYPPEGLEQVRDPVGRRFWPAYKGRDGERRPMQWDGTPGAGFTAGAAWLPVARDAAVRSVERQEAVPESLLNYYKALLRLRRSCQALGDGRYRALPAPAGVFAYTRSRAADTVLVLVNMSASECDVNAGAIAELASGAWGVLLGTHRGPDGVLPDTWRLEPLEAILLHRPAVPSPSTPAV
jgi:alpha-glucosidase